MTPTDVQNTSRPITGVLGDVLRNFSDLVRQEFMLARAEAGQQLSRMQVALAAIAIGGAVAFAGFIKLLDSAVYALGNVMGDIVTRFPALPALIVGGLVVFIGIAMIKIGINKFSDSSLDLPRTLNNVQRDQTVVKEHMP